MWTGQASVEQPVGPGGGLDSPALFLPTLGASEASLPAALHSQALRKSFPIPPWRRKTGRSKMQGEAGGRKQLQGTLSVPTQVRGTCLERIRQDSPLSLGCPVTSVPGQPEAVGAVGGSWAVLPRRKQRSPDWAIRAKLSGTAKRHLCLDEGLWAWS